MSVKAIHDIVTVDRLYPAGTVIDDLPQSIINDLRPLGSIVDVVNKMKAADADESKTSKKVDL